MEVKIKQKMKPPPIVRDGEEKKKTQIISVKYPHNRQKQSWDVKMKSTLVI